MKLAFSLDTDPAMSMWRTNSVTNGSGEPTSGPGFHRKNGSVQIQTCPKTRPTDYWWAKPRPITVNLRVSPGWARPVSSNLQFSISGFSFMVAFRYATENCKILTLVHHGLFLMYWPPEGSKLTDTRALSHAENERQQSVNDFWACILGNLGGDRL